MAKKSSQPQQKKQKSYGSQPSLPFHNPSISKADKTEVAKRLASDEIKLQHLDDILTENDWLRVKYDSNNGVWNVLFTYTPVSGDEPVGIVSVRARRISNALGLALWHYDELSESSFEQEEDDDF